MACREIGQWITDNVEKPLEEWFVRTRQQCTEARRWLEQRRREIEDWRQTQQKRCVEQSCQWLCLCCNKWFCWIVDILVRIVTILIEVIEHIIEAVCTLIVTLLYLVSIIVIQVIKWIVLAVVCLLESLCPILILIGAVALFVVLVAIVALTVPALAATATPIIPIAVVIAVVALSLARVLCETGRCRIFGAIGWALKWAIVIGAVIAIIMLNPVAALVIVLYGGLVACLAIAVEKIPCMLPSMLGLP
jgi:hypothetical protein